ncbi:MAG: hypothetical protein U0939_04725 [Pirellulales bacterium]
MKLKKYKPVAQQCINVASRRVSHLVVKRPKRDLPDVAADPDHPAVGEAVKVVVTDDENNEFEAKLIKQGTKKRRLALQLVAPDLAALRTAALADTPLEALISVTIIIATAVDPDTGELLDTTPMEVADVPVDYIVDEDAPAMPGPVPPGP